MADTPVVSGGTPVSMGPVGFWLDADGNVAATDPQGNPQVTPGMRDTPEAQLYYDSDKDLFYSERNGQKQYLSPYSFAGQDGVNSTAKGTGNGMLKTMDTGGGAFHGQPTWDQSSGTFKVSFDWGKIGSMIVGGLLTAGAVDAAFGSGAAAVAVSAPEGAVGDSTAPAADVATTAGSDILPSTAVGTGMVGGLPAGSTGLAGLSDIGAAAGATDVLPSTPIGTGDVAPIAGNAGLAPGAATAAANAGTGGLAGLGQALSGKNILGNLGAIGSAIGGAGAQAAQGRQTQADLALIANQENISGMSATEQALMARAKLEQDQRQAAQRNMARASYAQNPFQSPFAPSTGPRYSSQYMSTLNDLSNQGSKTLANPAFYETGGPGLPALQPYQPINIKDIPGATGTTPSTLANIGNVVGPGLSIIGALTKNIPYSM